MRRPFPEEYHPSLQTYIDLVRGENIIKVLQDQILTLQSLLTDISEEQEEYAYAEGKWTIKEVIGHITDTERILCYRALCIARGETQNLLSFDENLFVANANFNSRTIYDLSHEFCQAREGSLALFKSFNEEALNRIGTANSKNCSVRTILYMCAGHVAHHFKIIKTKYLLD